MRPLLHIYDADDLSVDLTASVRRYREWTYRVPIHDGKLGLRNALDALVSEGKQFSHALFETHGNVGQIFFGNQAVTGNHFRTYFAGRGYEKIFSYLWARIYLNGCNVMDDPFGWDLLDAAGSVFLKRGGGTVFAQAGQAAPLFSVVMCIILGRRPIRFGRQVECSPVTTWIRLVLRLSSKM